MIVASIAALLAAAQSPPQTPPQTPAPERHILVAFNVGVSSGETTPRGDGTVMVSQGGGAEEFFAVRLLRSSRDRLGAEITRPVNYDRHALSEREVGRDRRSEDPYSESNRQFALLEEALRHHQPAVALTVGRNGWAAKRLSDDVRAHRRCARRLLRAGLERLVATAENELQREDQQERLDRGDNRRRAAVRLDSPILLLRLLQLDLEPVASGYWSDLHRRAGERDPRHAPTQFDRRRQQAELHGREFALRVDLLSDRTSPAARACLMLKPRRARSLVSDRCSIDSVVDRRDGWPIAISVARHVRGANGANAHSAKSFSRVTPLQGFVAAPNPCAAAER